MYMLINRKYYNTPFAFSNVISYTQLLTIYLNKKEAVV